MQRSSAVPQARHLEGDDSETEPQVADRMNAGRSRAVYYGDQGEALD